MAVLFITVVSDTCQSKALQENWSKVPFLFFLHGSLSRDKIFSVPFPNRVMKDLEKRKRLKPVPLAADELHWFQKKIHRIWSPQNFLNNIHRDCGAVCSQRHNSCLNENINSIIQNANAYIHKIEAMLNMYLLEMFEDYKMPSMPCIKMFHNCYLVTSIKRIYFKIFCCWTSRWFPII